MCYKVCIKVSYLGTLAYAVEFYECLVSGHLWPVYYLHSPLGAGSALLGKEGAMACTVAVESVIGEHYNE